MTEVKEEQEKGGVVKMQTLKKAAWVARSSSVNPVPILQMLWGEVEGEEEGRGGKSDQRCRRLRKRRRKSTWYSSFSGS